MLAAAGSEAKDVKTSKLGEPGFGNVFVGGEDQLELARSRLGDVFRANGDGPAVGLFDGAVPGGAVVGDDVEVGQGGVIAIKHKQSDQRTEDDAPAQRS